MECTPKNKKNKKQYRMIRKCDPTISSGVEQELLNVGI